MNVVSLKQRDHVVRAILLLSAWCLAAAAARAQAFDGQNLWAGATASGPPKLLYAFSSRDLLILNKDDATDVTVVGPHGFPNEIAHGLTYNPLTDQLVGSFTPIGGRHQVVTFDRVTGVATPLGERSNVVGPEFVDSRGEIVASARRSGAERDLVTVDSRGVVTFLSTTGRDLDRTVYDSTHDVFYGINGILRGGTTIDNDFFAVDPATGASTFVRRYRNSGSGAAYSPEDQAIYVVQRLLNRLSRIDLSSGTLGDLTIIGSIPYPLEIRGLAFAPPPSAADQIGSLAALIGTMALSSGTQVALLSKLDAALKSLEKDNVAAAINQINAFSNQVAALTGKKISEADAALLQARAEKIVEALRFL